jgi:hypothetical protein
MIILEICMSSEARGTSVNPGTATGSSGSAQHNPFKPTPGQTYFVIEEDFDAIPLICFMGLTSADGKVVCFFEDPGSLRYYQALVRFLAEPTA